MYNFIREINHYSFNKEQKRFDFLKQIHDTKLEYLKYSLKKPEINIFNPVDFRKTNYLEESINYTDYYPIELRREKADIIKRSNNLNFLSHMNKTFEYCRNICHMPASEMRNLGFIDSKRKECVTDCLNVRAEFDPSLKNPSNKKTFVWLA